MSSTLPSAPTPADQRTLARWGHTRLRRRLLQGDWGSDLNDRLQLAIGHIRKSAWGVPDTSSNVFRGSVTQLAVLYDRAPTVTPPDGGETLVEAVNASGLWSLMQRVQRDTLGLREMFVRVEFVGTKEAPALNYRPVYPDLVEAWSTAEHPEEPIKIHEAVLRWKDNKAVWTYDAWDLTDPSRPSYRVLNEKGEDISAQWDLQGSTDEGYLWRKADGTPFIPYVLYHAAQTGMLFDPYEGSELVEGTLNIGVFWTMFGHSIRNCSWPQRYIVGARIVGEQTDPDETGDERDRHREIVTDPAVVLELLADGEASQVLVGQWSVAIDPAALQEGIALYERRIAASAGGIAPSDIQRVAGDPRSGFAISITREAQREAQRRFSPQFKRGDERLMCISAALWNINTAQSIPELGYMVVYESLPPSPEERQSEREHIVALIDAGLLDRVTAYQMLHPGMTESQAMLELEKIAGINAQTQRNATVQQ